MGANSSSRLEEIERIAFNRVELWPRFLGAEVERRRYPPGYFRALAELRTAALTGEVQRDMRRVAIDSHRLCPSESMHAAYQTAMSAYVLHEPRIAYVPSVGCIAVALLVSLQDAELVFWCLVRIIRSSRLFGGRPFGHVGFSEIAAFSKTVGRQLPRLVRHLESDGRGDFFDGVEQGLMVLGAAGWIGTLFAPHVRQSTAPAAIRFQLCHACIDACCVYGLTAAHQIALEVLRRAEPGILRAREFEESLIRPIMRVGTCGWGHAGSSFDHPPQHEPHTVSS